jgi:hypothetical protein
MAPENHRPKKEIDLALFQENWLKIPYATLQPYAGQWIAISGDGTTILASGPDLETAEKNLAALGIAGDEVGWDRVPGENEETWI